MLCNTHVFISPAWVLVECVRPYKRGHAHLVATGHLENNLHHHVLGWWRRWREKSDLYRHLLAGQETIQHDPADGEGSVETVWSDVLSQIQFNDLINIHRITEFPVQKVSPSHNPCLSSTPDWYHFSWCGHLQEVNTNTVKWNLFQCGCIWCSVLCLLFNQ